VLGRRAPQPADIGGRWGGWRMVRASREYARRRMRPPTGDRAVARSHQQLMRILALRGRCRHWQCNLHKALKAGGRTAFYRDGVFIRADPGWEVAAQTRKEQTGVCLPHRKSYCITARSIDELHWAGDRASDGVAGAPSPGDADRRAGWARRAGDQATSQWWAFPGWRMVCGLAPGRSDLFPQ
jgi:hypothetical protein